jgi:hypothetical protein
MVARGVRSGLNHGAVDLAMLHANELCAGTTPPATAIGLIEANAAAKGWLIFFTHDVAAQPSAHGCRPDELAQVVAAAARSGASILTMVEAAAALVQPGPLARPMLDPRARRRAGLAATGLAALGMAATIASFD